MLLNIFLVFTVTLCGINTLLSKSQFILSESVGSLVIIAVGPIRALSRKKHFAACEHQQTYPHTMINASVVHSLESRPATPRLASCKK